MFQQNWQVEWIPAWETERPANSINWSMEKAPELMSSLSSSAAFFAERVWKKVSIDSGEQWASLAFSAMINFLVVRNMDCEKVEAKLAVRVEDVRA